MPVTAHFCYLCRGRTSSAMVRIVPSRYSRIVESDRVSLDCLFGALHDMSSIAVNRKSALDLLTESLSASVPTITAI